MNAERLKNWIAFGLLITIAFTALAHGAVEPWSIAIFEFLILLLLSLWFIKILIEKQVELKIPLTFWPLGAFFILGLIQSISVNGTEERISSLSFDIEATRRCVEILFFLLISHLIAANFFDTPGRLRIFVKFVIVFGFGLSILGLIQFLTNESIFFWSRPGYATSRWLNGPFVNHNHFAGYMELIIPLSLAFFLTGAAKNTRLFYGFAAVIMTVAAVLSISRGGIISLAIGLIFVASRAFIFDRFKKSLTFGNLQLANSKRFFDRTLFQAAISAVLIIGAIFAGVVWLGITPVVERIADNSLVSSSQNAETFESSRGWVWKNSFAIFLANPVLGAGLGTFETAFPQYSEGYKATVDGKTYVWDRAHNDYLQILTDTGLIGGILAIWFIATIFITIRRGFYPKDPFSAAVAIGCGGAILSLLIHSAFDFNLQLPSTSLLFLTLLSLPATLKDK